MEILLLDHVLVDDSEVPMVDACKRFAEAIPPLANRAPHFGKANCSR